MHYKKIDFGISRDIISGLPDDLIGDILSFLLTKKAASTLILSKRWKNLLPFVPNLDFDDSVYLHPKNFMDFVDNVLALQANYQLCKFHLKCKGVIDPYRVLDWIPKVLERGVVDLDLNISSSWGDYDWISGYFPLPSKIFVSKTLVRLKIQVRDGANIDVEDDISLPKLKTLHLDHVWIDNDIFCKLLSGCHVLEELVLDNLLWDTWEPFSVSIQTVKRLRFCRTYTDFDLNSHNVSFDMPNLVYLEYSDLVAVEYPQVSFDSLVEASLSLRFTRHQLERIRSEEDAETEDNMICHVTNLLIGIRNVKSLHLSYDTLEVLNSCCEAIPIFDNLIHLTIKTHEEFPWRVRGLLRYCPNVETLILEGFHQNFTSTCKDEEKENDPKCFSSAVKIYKVLKFGENCDDEDMEEQIKQVKRYLETMAHLEKMIMILCCDTPNNEDVIRVSNQLQMLPKVTSSKCEIEVVFEDLS